MHKFISIFTIAITIFFSSCTKEDSSSSAIDFSNGSFVVNEGAFSGGTGTITFYNGTLPIQDVFGKQNNGAALGNIGQSMIKFGNFYFIAVNNADKIEVVNVSDFKSKATITGINLPRYFAANDTKLYVSSWNKDFATGSVNEIDPINFKILKSIPVTGLVEKMIIKNDIIYATVSATSTDILSKHIIMIDAKTNTLLDNIEVGDNTNDLVVDKNGILWVLCSGFNNWLDPSLNTPGSLNKVGDDVQTMSIANGAKGLVIDKEGQNLYYLAGGKVWQHDITTSITQEIKELSGNYYSIGLKKSTGQLFLADAVDFQQPGTITIFHPVAKLKKEFNAGIIPSFFYFTE